MSPDLVRATRVLASRSRAELGGGGGDGAALGARRRAGRAPPGGRGTGAPPRRPPRCAAMVLTVSTGYLPTEVSPESITASAPSQHRVGDVGRLRAGRPGVVDHRVEHLGGDDHRLARCAGTAATGALLHQRHLLQRAAPRRGHRGRPSRRRTRRRSPRACVDRLAASPPWPAPGRARRPRPSSGGRRLTSFGRGARTTGATRSKPRRSAKRRSSVSLSDIAGTLTATPGR